MSKNNIVVRLKQNNVTLEILAKPSTMKPYRDGKMKLENVLAIEEVFINASKVQKAKNSDLKKCCHTDDKTEVLKIIADKGTFPLSKKELQERTDGKRKEIVNYLHKYYYDPKNDPPIPHPVARLESVLDEMHLKIDPHTPIRQQLKPIVKKLPELLPVKPMNPPSDEYESTKTSGGVELGGGSGGSGGKKGNKNGRRGR